MATGCWLTEVRRWKSWRRTRKKGRGIGGGGGEAGSSWLERVCNDQQNSSAELEASSFRGLASSWMIPRNVVEGSSNEWLECHHATRGIMLNDFTSGPPKTLGWSMGVRALCRPGCRVFESLSMDRRHRGLRDCVREIWALWIIECSWGLFGDSRYIYIYIGYNKEDY